MASRTRKTFKEWREHERLSQEACGERLGVDARTIRSWDREGVPADRAEEVARAFKTTPAHIANIRGGTQVRGRRTPASSTWNAEMAADAEDDSEALVHRADATDIGSHTLTRWWARVESLAHDYLVRPLPTVLAEAHLLRREVRIKLDGDHHAEQALQLWAIAGHCSGIMAAAACDLRQYREATGYLSVAHSCADRAGDPLLFGWLHRVASSVHLWAGDLDAAVRTADAGLAVTHTGVLGAGLYSMRARAQAKRGHRAAVTSDIAAAAAARATATDSDVLLAGMQDFPLANQVRCAGTAMLWADEVDAAVEHFEHALRIYLTDPASRSHAHLAVTYADLGIAELTRHRIPSAVTALSPLRTTPSEARIAGLGIRLEHAIPQLRRGAQEDPEAERLADDLEPLAAQHAPGAPSVLRIRP